MNKGIAKFAVVGHPNKGKSSIVSTLAHDDSIQISSQSGTTTEAKKMDINFGHKGYELIDTPGFQRPHKVLAWLQQRVNSAEQHSQAVADFVDDPQCQQNFPDEVKLLRPVVDGAAILYVVDGSRPYGMEYEAEMEILRWSGQPSMALINPIESTAYVESWDKALHQYFKMVRVFNPMAEQFEKQIELLEAFAHLNPDWTEQLLTIAQQLQERRQQQTKDSITILSRLVEDLCCYQSSQKVLHKSQAKLLQSVLEKSYRSWMRKREQLAVKDLFTIYKHFQTHLSIEDIALPPEMFDMEQWYLWGLNKKQLAAVAALTGAAAGASIDMMVAGSSFMLGAVTGAVAGFATSWIGADKLLTTSLKGLPLGGYEAFCGPIKNKNFPYVVIGRYLFIHQQISQRNHALRSEMTIQTGDLQKQILGLERGAQKSLHSICNKLVKQQSVANDTLEETLSVLFQ